MLKLGFLTSCTCIDYLMRSGKEPTLAQLSSRLARVAEVVNRLTTVAEISEGVLEYKFAPRRGSDSAYIVLFSMADDDESINWPCKHCLAVLDIELSKLGGTAMEYVPRAIQTFSNQSWERVRVDGKLDVLVFVWDRSMWDEHWRC